MDINSLKLELNRIIKESSLFRPSFPKRYLNGDILDICFKGVFPAENGNGKFLIEKFAGSGFAGQVYRVKALEVNFHGTKVPGLEKNGIYAVKIIVPSSSFSKFFRNFIYFIAFQGEFSPQLNFQAARTGVLWQKLIKRGFEIKYGSANAVADTYATFFDENLKSFGEINEWINGRTWLLEIDDNVLARRKYNPRNGNDFREHHGSFEYLEKRKFMHNLVTLMHEMGARELSRQYEWSTWKSQPNSLKRMNSTDQMNQCLTAIDFRAGLALLPFLPMSPGDFRLIFQGVFHGSMVQFDRGDIRKLQTFIDNNAQGFQGFETLVEELKISERDYRSSLPDIAHHHIHLITNKELRKKIRHEFISAWNKKGYADEKFMSRLNSSHLVFFFFYGLGIIPLFGKLLRRYSGCLNYRKHINHCFTSWSYFLKTMRVIRAELLLSWCMEGRGSPDKLFSLVDRPINFLFQRIFLSWLPGALHRLLTDWSYTKAKIIYTVQYPIKFYREADFREQWFRQQLKEGYEQGMLTREEYDKISSKIKEPFIQKYLKCVAVHLCTLPVTTVVSISIALYTMLFLSKNMQEGLIYAAAILAFFQGTPISPGSITRGSYVFYLMIKERDIKNYWVAAIVSIWHYVGFLGFPMQMVTKYPALARFLAGKWATNIVGFVPVFGEKGALFEHKMFDLFFNVPLTIKRKFSRKK